MVWFNRQQQHHRELTQWYCSNNKQLRKRPPYNRSQPKTYPPTVLFFISEYKSVFSLGIRSQIRFLGARKTSCWNINLQRASQEANGGSRSGQKNGSRPQLHQCGKYFQKSLSSYPQNHLNIQIQSGIRFFIPIHITDDPFWFSTRNRTGRGLCE